MEGHASLFGPNTTVKAVCPEQQTQGAVYNPYQVGSLEIMRKVPVDSRTVQGKHISGLWPSVFKRLEME